jgi:hypothetical protein
MWRSRPLSGTKDGSGCRKIVLELDYSDIAEQLVNSEILLNGIQRELD